jgi:hypothetical protein
MRNDTKNALKMQDTWLHIAFNSDISDELGNTVPYPQHHYIKGNKIVYCWLIDGFFETNNNIQYLNDIIARFKITFDDCQYLKKQTVERSSINPLKLKQFQNLKSRAVDKVNERTQYDSTKDFIFWCIKFYAEDVIQEKGIVVYDDLESFAFENFVNKAKDNSTLKSKCRSILRFYINNNYTLSKKKEYIKKDKGEVMATRVEHALNLARKKEDENREKVHNAITGLMADAMFKKKNGTWNAVAIAEYLSMHPRTIRKYLKELK